MKKILIPYDYSEQAQNALSFACQIAHKAEIEIHILHVVDSIIPYGFSSLGEPMYYDQPFTDFTKLVQHAQDKLDTLEKSPLLKGLTVYPFLETGSVFGEIISYIKSKDIDMVVMGSKGASGLEELLIGSNTEKVVRHAKCPVLTIKSAVDLADMQTMIFATDLAHQQQKLANEVMKLRELLGLDITLLKINTFTYLLADHSILEERIAEYIEENGLTGIKTDIYDHEYVEDGILNYAEEHDVDLIAMGTHGHTGMAHIIAGSKAENITNHAKRPIWTFVYE